MSSSGDDGNMIEDLAQFDLDREIADSAQKQPWPSGLHSKTLVKKHDLRLVLIAMEPAAKMKEHHADGTISVQVLKVHPLQNARQRVRSPTWEFADFGRIYKTRSRVSGRFRLPANCFMARK